MSLNKLEFKQNIKTMLEDLMTREEVSIDDFSSGLADHVETFIKSANITYNTGLMAGSIPVTGIFNGDLT